MKKFEAFITSSGSLGNFNLGLNPNKVGFAIFIDDGTTDIYVYGKGEVCLIVEDLSDPGNDDIRDINHPLFERHWGNAMESTFISKDFKTVDVAEKWCLSIGMKKSKKLYSLIDD